MLIPAKRVIFLYVDTTFTIPISDNGSALAEMNGFLQSHKILKVEQHFYPTPNGATWYFCLKYTVQAINDDDAKGKINYKSQLIK
jgi:hypothetical protein